MQIIELLKALLFGVVEGITEWLPISSTGHMILLNEFVSFSPEAVSEGFYEMFQVVIQLGAILAVVLLYFKRLWPFVRSKRTGRIRLSQRKLLLWCRIALACIPAVFAGLLLDDWAEAHFYNPPCVAAALIVFGIAFIVIETLHKGKKPAIRTVGEIGWSTALMIGLFQVLAAIFPGTSRSGATIIGALLIGVSRTAAAEFTFYLAIPVMAGASLLKLLKFGLHFTGMELMILGVGLLVAFLVSLAVIRLLMSYIRKHDFRVFGWYRIALGIAVLVYFLLLK